MPEGITCPSLQKTLYDARHEQESIATPALAGSRSMRLKKILFLDSKVSHSQKDCFSSEHNYYKVSDFGQVLQY